MQKLLAAIFKAGQVSGSFLDRVINDSLLGDPTFSGDQYLEYDRLLAKAPIIRMYVVNGWGLLGFEAVTEALKDSRFSSDLFKNPTLSLMSRMASPGESNLRAYTLMMNTDPPEHGRLRKLARTGFLHKFVQSLEPKIRQITTDCLDGVQDDRQFDLIATLARPLPAYLISDVIGIDLDERGRLRELTETFLRNSLVMDLSAIQRADAAFGEIMSFMQIAIEKKRANPGDDFVSTLIAAEVDGDQLSTTEVTTMCVLLMIGGYETTTRLIGNAVYLLLRHPRQMEYLRDDPALLPNAIEEVLRFEPPLQFIVRNAREDMIFQGKHIKKNHTVSLLIAAANRDPAANENPHEFDIRREKINHITFGHGIHLCLGAELARLEGRVALEMILARYPKITLATEIPKWESGYVVRGLEELLLEVE